ncbi:MAG TPA: response regulator transcription factor [Nocardioidaceae bacterium]|nr:response regulator transcription factor [Nocardioidaceae bacterium]
MANVRAFLLDDHELVRRGIKDMLADTAGVEVVGEADRVGEGRRLILELRPDVAVLDARLPDGSGIDVCRDVRSADPDIHALILTSHDDDEALFSAIMAGASGYLLKDVLGTDLVDAIQRVAAGDSLLDPTVTGLVLDRIRRADEGPPELRRLSPREREILVLIAEGCTNREIAGRLTLTEPTVKTYVSRLFAKLDIERRTQAAVLATKLLKKR